MDRVSIAKGKAESVSPAKIDRMIDLMNSLNQEFGMHLELTLLSMQQILYNIGFKEDLL